MGSKTSHTSDVCSSPLWLWEIQGHSHLTVSIGITIQDAPSLALCGFPLFLIWGDPQVPQH